MHNVLMLWYKVIIAKRCKGDNFLANYADDFIAGFQYKWEAEEYYQLLKARMNKFGLELEESKSHMVMMGRYIANARIQTGCYQKKHTRSMLPACIIPHARTIRHRWKAFYKLHR